MVMVPVLFISKRTPMEPAEFSVSVTDAVNCMPRRSGSIYLRTT